MVDMAGGAGEEVEEEGTVEVEVVMLVVEGEAGMQEEEEGEGGMAEGVEAMEGEEGTRLFLFINLNQLLVNKRLG